MSFVLQVTVLPEMVLMNADLGKKIGSSGTVIALVNIFLSLYTYSSATTSGASDCSGLLSNDELRYRYVASSYKLLQYEAAEGKGDHLDGLAV